MWGANVWLKSGGWRSPEKRNDIDENRLSSSQRDDQLYNMLGSEDLPSAARINFTKTQHLRQKDQFEAKCLMSAGSKLYKLVGNPRATILEYQGKWIRCREHS
jgi:hypothetical protein